jgi:hypothetical protein
MTSQTSNPTSQQSIPNKTSIQKNTENVRDTTTIIFEGKRNENTGDTHLGVGIKVEGMGWNKGFGWLNPWGNKPTTTPVSTQEETWSKVQNLINETVSPLQTTIADLKTTIANQEITNTSLKTTNDSLADRMTAVEKNAQLILGAKRESKAAHIGGFSAGVSSWYFGITPPIAIVNYFVGRKVFGFIGRKVHNSSLDWKPENQELLKKVDKVVSPVAPILGYLGGTLALCIDPAPVVNALSTNKVPLVTTGVVSGLAVLDSNNDH